MAENTIAALIAEDDAGLKPYSFPSQAELSDGLNARARFISREDESGRRVTSGIFAASPGFIKNKVAATEAIYVLQGSVRITLDNRDPVELKAGDSAIIPAGSLATWTFTEPFKEFFVVGEGAR